MPLTVTFIAIGWGLAKSLLGSTSTSSLSAPTLNVRSSLIPVAVRTRRSCRPSAQSGAILSRATTASLFTFLMESVVIPGW